ncbi:MAG: hypothetical protein WCI97_07795 [Bacteroidota bacterium]
MMKIFSILFLSVLTVTLVSSCKKDKSNDPIPKASIIPVIELVSVTPTTVHALQDSIVFTIKYTDGDGDLGYDEADSMAVFLVDKRFPITIPFHLQPLSPLNTNISITGNLPIVLTNTILQNNSSASESAAFEIQIRDRANNYSNVLTTPVITVLP